MEKKSTTFDSFKEFYPLYLAEHQNKICILLHVLGTSIVAMLLVYILLTLKFKLLLLVPFVGYGFAWIGHFFFEKNKPASFKHPVYSFMGDWVMWWQFLTLKIKL